MKELGINPKDYKYLKSDQDSTTLQHKKGHLLTIAHNVLSPKNKAIMKALAETANSEANPEPKKMANGGRMEEHPGLSYDQEREERNYAVNAGLPCLNPNCKSHGTPHPNCRCYSGGESFAQGGSVGHFCSEEREHEPGCEYAKGGKVGEKSGTSMQGMDVRHRNETNDPEKKAMARDMARTEAKGRAQEERYIKPDIKGLAKGGGVYGGGKGGHLPGTNPEFWQTEHGKQALAAANKESDKIKSAPPVKKADGGPIHESWNGDRPAAKDSAGNMMSSEQCFADGGTPSNGGNPAIDTIVPDSGYGKIIIMKKANGGLVCHACGGEIHAYDEGGNVDPTTGQQDTSPRAIKDPETAKQAQQGAQQQGTMSGAWDNIRKELGFANGGQARNMYADAGVVSNQDQPQQDDQDGPIQLDVGSANVEPQAQPQVPIANNPQVSQNNAIANQAAAGIYTPEQARKDEAANMVKEANNFGVDNLSGQIKPKTYSDLFQDKNTFQKLSGLFGIIAGGMASGLTHQPNVALQMMDKVIDRDLDAQKTNASNKQNMWNSTYNHMLQEANARGLDTNSKLVQQEAAEKANTVAQMNTNQGFLGQMASKINTMPEGPAKEAYKKALYMSAQGIDLKHATLADQLAAKMIMFDKSGKGWNALQQQGQGQQPSQQTPQQGNKPQGASTQPQKNKYSILSPGSESKYEDIMNDLDPMWSKNKDLVNQQYTQAQQAEKILNGAGKNGSGGLDDVMSQMQDAQNKVGVWGHLHNRMQNSPGLLGEAEGAVAGLVPDTPSEKKYNALKTTLESDLGTALNGIMTPTDIHSAVSKYAPAFQDTPKDVEWKKQQLVNLVKKALRTSALTGAGLVKK